jgi:uncharacterized protein (UPF0332 family)
MLDKKRILESEKNMRNYLEEGLIKRKTFDKNIFRIFMRNSRESLYVANLLYEKNISSLWSIVCSYYSMYYVSNAILFKLGYKIGEKISHKICSDALIVFVRSKLKKSLLEDYENAREESLKLAGLGADEIIESFDFERVKRGNIQYQTTEEIKKSKAKTSLVRAKKFVFEMEKLLEVIIEY